MKKILLLCIIFSISFGLDLIPRETIERVADNFVAQRHSSYLMQEVLTYYGFDDQPNAYAVVFKNAVGEPFTVVVGARYTCTPISEFSKSLPNYFRTLEKAWAKARESLQGKPELGRIYYFGPQEEYFSFKTQDREILINSYSLQLLDKKELSAQKPERSGELENVLRTKWDSYINGVDFIPRDTAYIDSVPFVIWTYGCSPCAAAMLLWYWDSRGYGRLVDFFFDRWDPPENEWDFDKPNVAREMAIAMYTDTMTGSSYGTYFAAAFMNVCNTINGYSFSAVRYAPGNAANHYLFSYIKTEVDNQRPFHWSVYDHYPQVFPGGHSLTGIGYDIALPDTFVIVHNTWDYTEPHWALWTYYQGVYSEDGVCCVIPGGPNDNNLLLTFPQNSGLTQPQNSCMFMNLKYYLRWESLGSEIDHLKMWYSIGRQASSYDSLNWILIDQNVPNTGRYLWTVPAEDSAFRINISGLSSSNTRLAADGSLSRVLRDSVDHSSGVNLISHYDTDGSCLQALRIGDYLYCADGINGLVVLDAADSSVLDLVGHVGNIGSPRALFYQAPYLYVADYADTLRIFDLANPVMPSQIGHIGITGSPLRVFVQGDYAYLTCTVAGMIIVNCTDPSNPSVAGTFDSPGQAYDVFVSDTIAYLADGSAGLRIINVSSPASPVEINHYDPTLGITQGIEKNGDYLYLADGSMGVRILHLTTPAAVESLSVYNTPGVAKHVKSAGNLVFVADGLQGVRIISVADLQAPAEVGYLVAPSATALCLMNNLIYLADDADGVYVILHNLTHVQEYKGSGIAENSLQCPSLVNATQGIRFKVHLVERTHAKINLYDLTGRLVDTIYAGMLDQGASDLFYGKTLSAGVYFLTVDGLETPLFWKLLVVR